MTRHHLVLPARFTWVPEFVSDFAHHLLSAMHRQAEGFAGETANILLVDPSARKIWELRDRKSVVVSCFEPNIPQILFNPAFLLSDAPPLKDLFERANKLGLGLCGSQASREFYAFAFVPPVLTTEQFWLLLHQVTACSDEDTTGFWDLTSALHFIPVRPNGSDWSPAMEGISGVSTHSTNEAPKYWNTAVREILYESQDLRPVDGSPTRMAAALLAQRNRSKVPWLFNSLLNEVEYRLGTEVPHSYPPEVHVSLTGRCNIECGFCGYTHATARPGSVGVSEVTNLAFLCNIATLRLNSGLGEPSLVRDLPYIIAYVAAHAPHLYTNFFTNGIVLNRPGLIAALMGRIDHISASLNASTRESWSDVSGGADHFDRVCSNLRELHRAKRSSRTCNPLVFASIVLNSANIQDLPRLPSLCRELGIDRLTGFPYFGLGLAPDKFGPGMTLDGCRSQYDEIYDETVREAEANRVSLELPAPGARKRTSFGLEVRTFYDFASIERNFWTLGRFLTMLSFDAPANSYCAFLWRTASIGSTNNAGHSNHETHYLYPCIGPLSSVDLSRDTGFRFEGRDELLNILQSRLFRLLRRGQLQRGLCPVCDHCRGHDTRSPTGFGHLERLVAEFAKEHVTKEPLVQIASWAEKRCLS
jgi:hypothetical protein